MAMVPIDDSVSMSVGMLGRTVYVRPTVMMMMMSEEGMRAFELYVMIADKRLGLYEKQGNSLHIACTG